MSFSWRATIEGEGVASANVQAILHPPVFELVEPWK